MENTINVKIISCKQIISPDTHMDPGVFLDVTPHAHMLEINQHADSVHLSIYSYVQ